MTDMRQQPDPADDEVRHLATFITGHPDATPTAAHLAATRAILTALAGQGRLIPPPGTLIGPLTAAEWVSLRLTSGPDDILYCCADTSEVRDAVFQTLRSGAGPDTGVHLRAVWHFVEAHDTLGEHPLIRKLYDHYVAGQPPAPSDADLAVFLAPDPGTAEAFLSAAPQLWDTTDPVAARTALGRLAGKLNAHPDPAVREDYIGRVAAITRHDPGVVRVVFDAFRALVGLPVTAGPPQLGENETYRTLEAGQQ